MNKMKYYLVAVGVVVILGLVYLGVRNKVWDEQLNKVEFNLVDRGNYGLYSQLLTENVEEASKLKLFVINNQADWKRFWEEYIRSAGTGGFEKEPTIDFEKKIVVAVLQGVKNSGGYYMQTDSVELGGNTLKVNMGIFEPAATDANTQVISSPYELITIDADEIVKANKLIKVVNVNKNNEIVLEKKVSDLLFKK